MNKETHQSPCIVALEMVNAQIKDCGSTKRRKELEAIQKVLFESIENEKKIISKCNKLRVENTANISKVKAAIRLSEEDESTISMLKKELEKAWYTIKQLNQQGLECTHNTPTKSVNELRLSNENYSLPNETKPNDQNAILEYKKEIFEIKEQRKNLLSEIESLKRKLDERERNSHHLQEENKRLILDVNNSNSLKGLDKKLERQLNLNEKEIQKLKKELSAMQERAITENEKFKLQIFELEEELADKEKRVEELKIVSGHKGTNTIDHEVQTAIEEYTFEIGNTSSKKTLKYKRQLKKMTSDLEKMIHLYNNRGLILKKLKFKLSTTEEALNSLKTKYIQLKDDYGDKTGEKDTLVEQNGKLKDEVKKLSASISILEEIRDDYTSVIGKKSNELDHLKEELAKSKTGDTEDNWKKQSPSLKTMLRREQQFLVEHKLERMKERHKAYEDILLQMHHVINRVFDSSKIEFSEQYQHLKEKYTLAQSLKNKVLVLIDNFEKMEAKSRILRK